MTTNVYDISAALLTSDSRWSYEESGWIVYVDDTAYDKIAFDEDLGLLFAGNLTKIDIWKKWLYDGRLVDPPLDQVDDMSIIGVDMHSGNVIFWSDYLLNSIANNVIEAWYGGTGGPYAKDCWQLNRCAQKAISTAIEKDDFSGGSTVYVRRSNFDTNIRNSVHVSSVLAQMKERGIMLNVKGSRDEKLLKDAVNDPADQVAHSIAKKVMSGKAALGAPFPGMAQPWTQEKKDELAAALRPYVRK